MDVADVTLAARGQIVIPKEARDALGLKPGARLSVRIEGSRLVIEKRVALDLSRWMGKAVDDGLTTEQALTELRGRAVPWVGAGAAAAVAKVAPDSPTTARKPQTRKSSTVRSPASPPVGIKSKSARK